MFKNNENGKNTLLKLLKYYVLVVIQICASAGLVYLFVNLLGLSKLIIKIIVDTLIFFISFRIQKALGICWR